MLAADKEIGITSGKIISYTYNSMISLAFISAEYAKEGTELESTLGNAGTRQMKRFAQRLPDSRIIRIISVMKSGMISDIPVFER